MSKKKIERRLGRELWDYRIVGRVYKGALSTVCKATAPDDSVVAIKFMNVDQPHPQKAEALFRREAYLLAQLDHPRILKFIDYYPESYQPAIIMEFFDPTNLKQRIMKRDAAIENHGLTIMVTFFEALAYLHEQVGFLHRDIKPENILVSPDGQARIVDFSIAVPINHFTFFRKIAGSRSYIAPETIRRRRPSPQTDIYSAGCTFYEMLTRRQVFTSADANVLLRKHLKEKPSSPRQYNPKISPAAERLIMKMLEKKPQDRPESCSKILIALAQMKSLYS